MEDRGAAGLLVEGRGVVVEVVGTVVEAVGAVVVVVVQGVRVRATTPPYHYACLHLHFLSFLVNISFSLYCVSFPLARGSVIMSHSSSFHSFIFHAFLLVS